MAAFSIQFKPSVYKDLKFIPKSDTNKILKKIDMLKYNPLTLQSIKLSGAEKLYRIRIGDYRVIYEINNLDKLIVVHYIRHRREVYRNL